MAGLTVMTNMELVKRYLRRERQDFDVVTDRTLYGRRETVDNEVAVGIRESLVERNEFWIALHRRGVQVVLTRDELRSLVDQAEVLEV